MRKVKTRRCSGSGRLLLAWLATALVLAAVATSIPHVQAQAAWGSMRRGGRDVDGEAAAPAAATSTALRQSPSPSIHRDNNGGAVAAAGADGTDGQEEGLPADGVADDLAQNFTANEEEEGAASAGEDADEEPPPKAPADDEHYDDPGLDYSGESSSSGSAYEDDEGSAAKPAAAARNTASAHDPPTKAGISIQSADGGQKTAGGGGGGGGILGSLIRAAESLRAKGGAAGAIGGKRKAGEVDAFEYDDEPPEAPPTTNKARKDKASKRKPKGSKDEDSIFEVEEELAAAASEPPAAAGGADVGSAVDGAEDDAAADREALAAVAHKHAHSKPLPAQTGSGVTDLQRGFGSSSRGRLRSIVKKSGEGKDGDQSVVAKAEGGSESSSRDHSSSAATFTLGSPLVTTVEGSSGTAVVTPASSTSNSGAEVTPRVTPAGESSAGAPTGSSTTPIVTHFVDPSSLPLITPAPGSKVSMIDTGALATPGPASGLPMVTPAGDSSSVPIVTPASSTGSSAAAQPAAPSNATVARITIPSHSNKAVIKSRSSELTPVTFDASTSSNADAYSWTVSQIRPVTQLIDLGLPFPEPPKFEVLLGSGEYLVMLRVAGPHGQATQQTLLTIQRNTQPVASAGGPYTGYVGRPVRVTAARSADADGDPLKFRWQLTLADSSNVIAEVFDVDASFTLNRVGEYVLTLEADDGRGGVSATQTDLLVLPASMAPDLARPSPLPSPVPAPAPETAPAAAALPGSSIVGQQQQQQQQDAPPPRRRQPAPSYAPAPQQASYGGDGGSAARYQQAPAPARQSIKQPTNPRPTAARQASPYTIAASSSTPVQLPLQQPVGQMAPLAPNKPSPNTPPQCLFDKTTGVGVMAYDILALPPITNVTAWANKEWRDCASGPIKPVGATMPGTSAGPAPPVFGVLTAVIASPPNVVSTEGNRTAKVVLDASGSQAAPLKPILFYSWTIKRLPDQLQVAATGNKVSQVWLHTGIYAATLTVTDLNGGTASASKIFAVWPVMNTTAAISSPKPFVLVDSADATEVRACVCLAKHQRRRLALATAVLCCCLSRPTLIRTQPQPQPHAPNPNSNHIT